ncbi:AraC family transcriptional regulator [Nonomuraea sp. NPDC050643]|uniref:AraC family transcriptional regulator n=1 Tax=Nonomuraea sp. NPDC050643 TaxID=3155660 RepID=UPI0033DE25C5
MQVTDVNGTHLAVISPASGGFPPHSHDEYVISVNLCGRERVRLDRASFEVDLDEVTAYNPGQVQSCTTRTPEETVFTCVSWYVPPAALSALTGGPPPDFERPVVRAAHLRTELIQAARTSTTSHDPALLEERLTLLLLHLLDLTTTPTTTSPLATTSSHTTTAPTSARTSTPAVASTTTAASARTSATTRAPATATAPADTFTSASASLPALRPAGAGPGDARIAAVLDRLRGDLSRAPRLADLAEYAGVSREHLIRSFTRAMGCPPYAWHLQARLAEGRRRLRRGVPVADVAHGLGFADQAHFHRHFLAAYAITPGRYRSINI